MTIPYALDTSTTNPLSFVKILCRWHGSAWKNCATEYLAWLVTYFLVTHVVSQELLPFEWHGVLNGLVDYLDSQLSYLPIVLLLGFFVTFVIDRWKNILNNIGFIDCAAFVISSQIQGDSEDIVTQRRNILRYLCVAQVLTLRDISIKVRQRFPTLESLVQSNLLLEHELVLLRDKDTVERYTTPINWAVRLSEKLCDQNCMGSPTILQAVVREITDFQKLNQNLCNYDWVPVPLAYPQVAFCVVRVYLFISIFARQVVFEHAAKETDLVSMESWAMMIMTMLQVFFYLAWVKVAEEMLNPLGCDDNDFECNFVIDHNITLALRLADTHHGEIPTQLKDEFDENATPLYPANVPFKKDRGYRGSVAGINITKNKKITMVPKEEYTEKNTSSIFSASSASILLPLRMTRRLTHPLTMKRQYSMPNTHLPTISKQLEIRTTAHPDEIYSNLPEVTTTLYRETPFAESYAFQYHRNHTPTEEPIFAQSIRPGVHNILCKPSDV